MSRALALAVVVCLAPAVAANDPEDAGGFYKRGCVRYVKGEHDKAIADFTEAISTTARL